MARQGAESMVSIDSVHLSYLVGGSGGAGTAAMRTTFMGLQRPFDAWIDGQWETVKPYTGREVVEFPRPYGRVHVYWYDMPEQVTLPESLSVQRVITKFGIFPDFYNHLTWMAAHWFPSQLLQNSMTVEFLAQVSHQMTKMSDRFSGTGVAVRCDVYGQKAGNPVHYCSTFTHEGAAAATGCGTGIIAQLVLAGTLNQPGVWSVEQILSTDLFEQAMQQRHLKIQVK
jgi:saccharopine dehydrogenase-like NADP-dependent oxidoreductase